MTIYRPLDVLVVGAGMYVCGRGTDGFGTVLPALYQAKKEGLIRIIRIAATGPAGIRVLKEKKEGLDQLFGFSVRTECFPRGKAKDARAYQNAMEDGWIPDCAIISVPDHLHFEVASYLVERKVHCLVVKPLAPTVSEVEKLIHLADATGAYGAVELHKRFDRSNLRLKDTIGQGLIGDPLYFAVEYSQRKSIPVERFRSWVQHTDTLQYLGIHYLDIIYFVTRAIPLRVLAVGQKNFLVSEGIDAYDSIQCVVEWKMPSGCKFTSTLLTNWIDPEASPAMSNQKIKVIGTKGRYEADQGNRGISIVTDEKGPEEPNPDFSSFYGVRCKQTLSFQGYGMDSIRQFLKDVASIRTGELIPGDLREIRPTFKEALVPTAILEAARQSLARDNAWVQPEARLFRDEGIV